MLDRLRTYLGHDKADPQARDERPAFAVTDGISTQAPNTGDIDDWIVEYKRNPLVHQPVDQFPSDVAEPGYRVDLSGDGEPPTVTGDSQFSGDPLDDALEQWLGGAAIIAGEFHRDFGDLVEDAIKDARGRRGTALVEHIYDDRGNQDQLLALRLFKAETVTAYTRPGKAILLRPDDDPADLDSAEPMAARRSFSANSQSVPTTAAGETAAYVQFDDVLGSEPNEVPLAQSDVTKIANNPDSGEIFGEPDVAQVYDRGQGIRQQLSDLDRGLQGKMFGYWIASVGSEERPVDKDTAEDLVGDMALNDPTSKTAVPYQVSPEKFDGEVPDVENVLQYQIEYVLSAMPTPVYRVGFAGDINRDIAGEQQTDYQDEVRRWRRRLESAFQAVLQRKADELVDDAPKVRLRIEPEQDESPLRDEQFDATAFKEFMQGLKAGAPGGAPELVVPPETIVDDILKMDSDAVLDEVDGEDAKSGGDVDEDDDEVQAQFSELYRQAEADD